MSNSESNTYVACEFVKGHYKPNKINTIKNNPTKEQKIKKDNLLTRHMVSIYHYIFQATGRLFHMSGNPDPSEILSYGCVFVNYAGGFMSTKQQVTINSTKNVKTKLNFYGEYQIKGVVIKGYHIDNEVFNTSEVMDDMLKN